MYNFYVHDLPVWCDKLGISISYDILLRSADHYLV